MEYKGYTARVEFDEQARSFYGEVIGTRDVITFQGDTVDELYKAFEDSIDDYLEYCASLGKEPDKPFSGKFMVRLSPELHRMISLAANKSGKSLNTWIMEHISRDVLEELN